MKEGDGEITNNEIHSGRKIDVSDLSGRKHNWY